MKITTVGAAEDRQRNDLAGKIQHKFRLKSALPAMGHTIEV